METAEKWKSYTKKQDKLAYIKGSTADMAKEDEKTKVIADAALAKAEEIMQGIKEAGLLTQSQTQTGTAYTDKAVVEAGPAVSWNRETACEEPLLHKDGTPVYSGTIKIRHGDTTITMNVKENVTEGAKISSITTSKWDRSGDIPRLKYYKQDEIKTSPISKTMKAVAEYIISSGVIDQRAPQSELAAFAVEANRYFTESGAKVVNEDGKTVNNAYAKYEGSDYGEKVVIYNHDDNVVVELGVTDQGDRYAAAVNYDLNEQFRPRAQGEKPLRVSVNNPAAARDLISQGEIVQMISRYKIAGAVSRTVPEKAQPEILQPGNIQKAVINSGVNARQENMPKKNGRPR